MDEADLIRIGIVAGRELRAETDAKIVIVPETTHSSYRCMDFDEGVDSMVELRKWSDGSLSFHAGYEPMSRTLILAFSRSCT